MLKVIKLVLIVLMLGGSASLYAQDYQLFWLEKPLPTEKIIEFSKLSENKMIETLRTEYKIRVLIYGSMRYFLKEDQELFEYFRGILVDKNNLGEYFPPYYGLKTDDNITRPSWDEPIILVQALRSEECSVRVTLIHEFIHHNIYLLRSEAPTEIDGVKYSQALNTQIKLHTLEKQWKALEHKDTKEALLLSSQIMLLKLQVLNHSQEEEMDVYRFIYDYRDSLNLPLEEIKDQWGDIKIYNGTMHYALSDIYQQLEQDKRLSSDPELLPLWKDIEGQLDSLQQKYVSTDQWLEEQRTLIHKHPELFPK